MALRRLESAVTPESGVWIHSGVWRVESGVTTEDGVSPESGGWSLEAFRRLEHLVWSYTGV